MRPMNSARRLTVVSERRCSCTRGQLMSNAKLVVCPHCDSINRVPADRAIFAAGSCNNRGSAKPHPSSWSVCSMLLD
ncbi:MAG: hypothetical protein ACE10E_03795 [Acidiferrobacterales bacterium]